MTSFQYALGAWMLALGVTPLSAQQGVPADSLLARLTAETLANNPGLAQLNVLGQAASARSRAAGALPDPTLKIGVSNLELPRFAFRRSDFTEVDVEAEQEFPWPGTLSARSRAASARASGRQADIAVRRRELVVKTASLYNRLRYVLAARQILGKQHALLESAVETSTARYASGAAPQSDPLAARVARARLSEDAAALAAEEARLRASLRALRGVTAPEMLAVFPIESREIRSVYPDFAARAHAGSESLDQHPLLASRRAAILASDETAREATLGQRPGFTVMARYGARTIASDFFSAAVGLRVPLWKGRKQRQLALAARLDADGDRAALLEERATLESEYEATIAEAEAGLERLRLLLDEILPSAEAARDAALRSYQAGKVDFLTVLTAGQAAFQTQLEAAEVAAEHLSHLVMLQQLSGPEDTP